MRLLKLIFAIMVSLVLILSAYYFIWNFLAKSRHMVIKTAFDESQEIDFDYKTTILSGYPNDINITFDDLTFSNKDSYNQLDYTVGDVLFKIYPFVLDQQFEIKVPSNQFFKITTGKDTKEFKIQTSNIDVRALNNELNLDMSDVKIFEVTTNQLLLRADKIYYSSDLRDSKSFEINFRNLKVKGHEVDSTLLKLKLTNTNRLDLISMLLNMLVLKGDEQKQYYKNNLKQLHKNNAEIDIVNMKFVDANDWFDLIIPLKVDFRNRLSGNFEVVSNNIDTSEKLLKILTANDDVDIRDIDIIKRLLSKNDNGLIRLSGKMDKGFLAIFNQNVVRVKPQGM